MTDLKNELRELPIDEMTGEELDTVTGGGNPIITAVVSAIAAYDKWTHSFHIATELH